MKISAAKVPPSAPLPLAGRPSVRMDRSATREHIIDNWTQKDQFPCRVKRNLVLYDSTTPTGLAFNVSLLPFELFDNNKIFIQVWHLFPFHYDIVDAPTAHQLLRRCFWFNSIREKTVFLHFNLYCPRNTRHHRRWRWQNRLTSKLFARKLWRLRWLLIESPRRKVFISSSLDITRRQYLLFLPFPAMRLQFASEAWKVPALIN